MTSRRFLLLSSTLIMVSFVRAESPGANEKPLVYDNVTKGSGVIDREAKKAYAGKFRFMDVAEKDGFVPGGLKGLYTSQMRFRDPRSTRQSEVPAKVVYTFIVTPDGGVLDPRILSSTDEKLSKYLIKKISNERYFPARFRGTPVYSLHGDEWKIAEDPASSKQSRDGLGIMKNRDR